MIDGDECMNELLQEAINEMNSIEHYHRCFICDYYKDDSCDRGKYLECNDFTWHGLKPVAKEKKGC